MRPTFPARRGPPASTSIHNDTTMVTGTAVVRARSGLVCCWRASPLLASTATGVTAPAGRAKRKTRRTKPAWKRCSLGAKARKKPGRPIASR